MSLAEARRVADAVLFEGYVLYPYRSTSAKNRLRWQFGVLGPQGAAEAGAGEAPAMQAELLVATDPGAAAVADVRLRFLQARFRAVERAVDGSGRRFEPVDELRVGVTRWVSWHEAAEREVALPRLALDHAAADRVVPVEVAGGEETEVLHDTGGRVVGRLVRTCWPLTARLAVSVRRLDGERPLTAVRLRLENVARWRPARDAAGQSLRDLAARGSFIGTHLLAQVRGGGFVSLTDPPAWAASAAASCVNDRCWPVLLGAGGRNDIVLASPIILPDHPAVAEQSPGDFFDATEIDEMLTLRVMTLTDEEKLHARGTDPRAAAIIERCDGMTPDALARLHGVIRDGASGGTAGQPPEEDPRHDASAAGAAPGSCSPAPPRPATVRPRGRSRADDGVVWWDPDAAPEPVPEHDSVRVDGVEVAKGSRVLVRPTRRADAQDLFLAGRAAVVAGVHRDVDGGTHISVLFEDDPASDLHEWYGRSYFFAPDELEPLPPSAPGPGEA